MLELVSDILDVAKIEAGKFNINKQEGDITKVIKIGLIFILYLQKTQIFH